MFQVVLAELCSEGVGGGFRRGLPASLVKVTRSPPIVGGAEIRPRARAPQGDAGLDAVSCHRDPMAAQWCAGVKPQPEFRKATEQTSGRGVYARQSGAKVPLYNKAIAELDGDTC